MSKPNLVAPLLALAGLVQAQALVAQQPCVDASDLGDAVIYAMPIGYEATQSSCSDALPRDGYLAREGDAFVQQFRDRQDAAWPGALRLLRVLMEQGRADTGDGPDMRALIASLPENDLRPFVDAIVRQMLADEIKPESCADIERAVELLAPLPAENVAGLIAFIARQAGIEDPAICPVEGAGGAAQ